MGVHLGGIALQHADIDISGLIYRIGDGLKKSTTRMDTQRCLLL